MTRPLLVPAALALLAAGCGASPRVTCGPFPSAADVRCFPAFDYQSVVRVDSGRERGGVYRTRNSGSGLVLAGSGLVVTASHVVNGRDRLAVHAGGAVYAATRLPEWDAKEADVAWLRISGDGRPVADGCILSDTLSACRLPVARVAATALVPPPFGAEVQVIGYPSWKPELLRGRLVDPKPKLERFVAEHSPRHRNPERPGGAADHLTAASASADSIQVYADALALLRDRIRGGYLFVELDTSGRHPGISGGAVVLAGEAVGMVVESWNSFERAILICAPLSLSDRTISLAANGADLGATLPP